MKTRTTAALAAAAVGVLGAVPASAGAALINPPLASFKTETLTVDSRTGTATSNYSLLPVVSYTVKVEGTYSSFNPTLYNQPAGSYWATCGAPRSAPEFPTPSVTNGPTGADAEFLFAAPLPYFSCGNFKPPTPLDKFQIDTGSGFQDPVPVGGQPTTPSADHTYTYRVYSSALLAPVKFKIIDGTPGDNYGRLKITISLDVI